MNTVAELNEKVEIAIITSNVPTDALLDECNRVIEILENLEAKALVKVARAARNQARNQADTNVELAKVVVWLNQIKLGWL